MTSHPPTQPNAFKTFLGSWMGLAFLCLLALASVYLLLTHTGHVVSALPMFFYSPVRCFTYSCMVGTAIPAPRNSQGSLWRVPHQLLCSPPARWSGRYRRGGWVCRR